MNVADLLSLDSLASAAVTERAETRAEFAAARARAASWQPRPCPPPPGWVERTPRLDEIDTPRTRSWIR